MQYVKDLNSTSCANKFYVDLEVGEELAAVVIMEFIFSQCPILNFIGQIFHASSLIIICHPL